MTIASIVLNERCEIDCKAIDTDSNIDSLLSRLGSKDTLCSAFKKLDLNLWKETDSPTPVCEWQITDTGECCSGKPAYTVTKRGAYKYSYLLNHIFIYSCVQLHNSLSDFCCLNFFLRNYKSLLQLSFPNCTHSSRVKMDIILCQQISIRKCFPSVGRTIMKIKVDITVSL